MDDQGEAVANVVVFDVGGTKVASTVIDQRGRDLLNGEVRRFETPERAPAEIFVAAMVKQLQELQSEFGDVIAWGAAFPGPFKRLSNGELLAFPQNIPAMRGHSLVADMCSRLPHLPGVVDNDLKLAMRGERLIGCLRETENAIGFVHSTGVSSATLMNGEIVRGTHNNAGEISCVMAERDPARARPCDGQDGRVSGHLEAQIRGPVLAEIFFGVDRHDKAAVRSVLESASREQKLRIVEYCVPYAVDVLAPIMQATATTTLVLFGGISTWLGKDYCDSLTSELRACSEVFCNEDGRVLMAEQPHLAPLIGAADTAFSQAELVLDLSSR